MKLKIVCCLLFVVSSSVFAQSKEERIQQLINRKHIKVTEVEKDKLKLEYPNGKVIYENIGEYEYPEFSIQKPVYSPTYDSTIIDLSTIDTTLYYQKYNFLQEVNIGSPYTAPPLLGDVNKNNLAEIYAIYKDYNSDFSGIVVMEQNNSGSFDSIYLYDNTTTPRAIYDIDKDGMEEVPFRRYPSDTLYPGHSWLFFKKTTDTSLATDLSFIFYPFPDPSQNQLNNNTFGDWDGDEYTEQLFGRDCCPNSIFIYEYNPLSNNFDSVYYYDPSQYDIYFSGFALGDINQNGKTEFFSGSVNGKIISIESCGNNCYEQIWQSSVETYNAYLYAVSNDLDGNGKPEVWIGGYHFQDGEAITRLTIFEASGNNNYVAVGKIDIIGAFNFYAKNMQVIDVDKDGNEEVMLCIEQHVIILKFKGSQNHHTYEVFYIKRNDLAYSGRNSVFYGAKMYDVTNDGKEDIIIHLDEASSIPPWYPIKLFTFIYKSDLSVNVDLEIRQPQQFNIYSNFPNPFNPSTKLRFEIPDQSNVSIKVYNILGKEITTLLDKEMTPGNYTINWEAKDSNRQLLPAGVYFITFNAEDTNQKYTATIKSILLK